MSADFTVRDQGTILLFTPETSEAKDYTESEIPTEPWQWWGAAFAVDHRPASELIEGLICEGFTVALC